MNNHIITHDFGDNKQSPYYRFRNPKRCELCGQEHELNELTETEIAERSSLLSDEQAVTQVLDMCDNCILYCKRGYGNWMLV